MENNSRIFSIRTRLMMIEMKQEKKTVTYISKYLRTSRKTVHKWLKRYDNSIENLCNRKTIPKKQPYRTPKDLERLVIRLRDRKHWSSLRIHIELRKRKIINPITGKYLAESTVRKIFERYKRGYKYDRLKRPKPKIVRYERQRAGELVHIDVKKLKNVKGENPKKKKYAVAVVDDATRITYSKVVSNKKALTLATFLGDAYFYFKNVYNIEIESILSDNGKEFTHHNKNRRKPHCFEAQCENYRIKHIKTRVRRPQTNGKVERLWRTLDEELFNRLQFESSKHRKSELEKYLRYYNNRRTHMGIDGLSPVERLQALRQ